MSHLVLVTEVKAADPETGGSDDEPGSDEQRPLLGIEGTRGHASSSQRDDAKVTSNCSLVPEASLPAQVRGDMMLPDSCYFSASQTHQRFLLSVVFINDCLAEPQHRNISK